MKQIAVFVVDLRTIRLQGDLNGNAQIKGERGLKEIRWFI